MFPVLEKMKLYVLACRSQWSRDLRRGSAVARLQGLGVRIPPGHGCLSLVSVVCCQLDVCATSRSLVLSSVCACVCVIECDQVQH